MAIPRTDAELALWLTNFSTSFEAHATGLGFTEAEVNSVKADAAMLNYLVGDFIPTYKSALQARTSYKNRIINSPAGGAVATLPAPPATGPAPAAVAPGILARLRVLVQRIQLAPRLHGSRRDRAWRCRFRKRRVGPGRVAQTVAEGALERPRHGAGRLHQGAVRRRAHREPAGG